MDLNTRLRQVAVVGAAGKMGSGIALLLALELGFRGGYLRIAPLASANPGGPL